MVLASESFDATFPTATDVKRTLLDREGVIANDTLSLFLALPSYPHTGIRAIGVVIGGLGLKGNTANWTFFGDPSPHSVSEVDVLANKRAIFDYSEFCASRWNLKSLSAYYALVRNLLALLCASTFCRAVTLPVLANVLLTTVSALGHATIILHDPALYTRLKRCAPL